jgi:hypothetical protein
MKLQVCCSSCFLNGGKSDEKLFGTVCVCIDVPQNGGRVRNMAASLVQSNNMAQCVRVLSDATSRDRSIAARRSTMKEHRPVRLS